MSYIQQQQDKYELELQTGVDQHDKSIKEHELQIESAKQEIVKLTQVTRDNEQKISNYEQQLLKGQTGQEMALNAITELEVQVNNQLKAI